MTAKDRTIEAILEIELQMFLTVNPEQASGCQEHPESFKLHRRAQFAPWSEEALGSYLEDLHAGGARNAFRAHPGTSPPGPAGDKAPGESLSEKVYDCLVRARGYASLKDTEMKLQAQRCY